MLQIDDPLVERLWRALDGEECGDALKAAKRFVEILECCYGGRRFVYQRVVSMPCFPDSFVSEVLAESTENHR